MKRTVRFSVLALACLLMGGVAWATPPEATDMVTPPGEIKDPNPPPLVPGVPAPRASGGPDAFGYSFEDSNEVGGPAFSWVDITGTGTLVAGWSSKDDGFAGPFALGLTFPFYGVNQTQFYTGSNGIITFGAGSSSLSNQCPFPNATTPNNLMALLWDDLNLNTSGDAYYQYFAACPVGSGPCSVIEYYNIAHYGGAVGSAGTWEAVLYPSGNILTQFLSAGTELGSGSTTGIEDATGTVGLGYACNTANSLANNLVVLYYLPPVGILTTDQSGCPGDVISCTVTITNRTGADTTFDLGYTGNAWLVNGPATVAVASGASVPITVTHTIFIMATTGTSDSFILTATDQANPANVATRTVTTSVSSGWTALPAMATGVSRPAGAAVGGKFYVIGGESTGGYQGLVQIYDSGTALWSTSAAIMPTPASNITGAAIGTDIYIPGGGPGVAGNTLQVYSTATDSWTTVATDPLPSSRFGAACAAYGGKLYVFGGNDGSVMTSTTYIYDPAAPAGARWTTGLAAPVADYFGTAVPVGNLIFWAGLYSNSTAVYAYDPAANTWTQYPNLSTARGGAGAWSDGTMLYVGAGGWATYLNTMEIYDTTQGPAGSWVAGPSLITGRRAFAPATDTANGIFYAGGGWNGGYMTAAEELEKCVPSCLLTLAPAVLPNGSVGAAYSQTITAAGGTPPYTYGVLSGSLPAGLGIDPVTGILSGTPTVGGAFTFTLYAYDTPQACLGTLQYTLIICAPITVAPATLPDGNLGLPYSATVTASGGTAPYTYAVTAGALPAGVTLDPLTGVISGIPTSGGPINVTITATDANGCTGFTAYTAVVATYDVNLLDDYSRAFVCINTASGAWSWTILRGPGVGLTFTGVGILTNFNGTVTIASPAGQPINVTIKYLARYHKGSATFLNRPARISSAIYDNNTLNNTVVCP